MPELLSLSLYLLALINPVSKIFILGAISRETDFRGLARISLESSGLALVILIVLALSGNFILTTVFHVSLTAFRIAGGIIVFTIGAKALSKGLFFETTEHDKLIEEAIVPIASPMIAGPGTITASIAAVSEYGTLLTIAALGIALTLNLGFMLSTRLLNRLFFKHHIASALIRITGFIVATIGVQMILDGSAAWLAATGLVR